MIPSLTKRVWQRLLLMGLLLASLAACNLIGGEENEDDPADDVGESVPTVAPQPADDDAAALTVEINSPTDGSEVLVNTDVLVYSAARDSVGVTRVELRANGALVDSLDSPNPGGQRELFLLQTWQPEQPGQAVLEVTAYRGPTTSTRDSIRVEVRAQQADIRIPAPTPAVVAPEATANTTCRARVTIGALNLRDAPGLATNIQTVLDLGTVAPLIGRTGDNQWWQVRADGRQGWISAPYATLLGNCAGVPVTGQVAAAPTATATTVPLQPTETNTPQPSATPLEAACVAQALSLDVPVRNAPDSGANAVGSLAQNERRPAIARTSDNAWVQVTAQNAATGWVSAADLALFGECDGLTVQEVAFAQQNQSPQLGNIPPQSIAMGDTQTINFAVSDPDGDSVSLAVAATDGNVLRAFLSGPQTIQLQGLRGGTTNVQITATDGQGGTTTRAFNVAVLEPENEPPSLAQISAQTLEVEQTITVPVTTSDPEGENVVLRAESADPGIIVAAPDGQGNITLRGVRAGRVEIRVTADDLGGGRTSVTFPATVTQPEPENQAPLIAPVLRQTLNLDESRTLPIGMRDPEGGPLSITEAVSNAPGVVSVDIGEDNSSLMLVAQGPGDTQIDFTVTDDEGATSTERFGVTVLEPTEPEPENRPPTLRDPAPVTLPVGQTTVITLAADDPDDDPLSLSDVTAAPGGIVSAVPGDDLSIALEALASGQTTLSVTVADPAGASVAAEVVITVPEPENRPPTLRDPASVTLPVGQTTVITLAANDPDGDPLSLSDVTAAPEGIVSVVPGNDLSITLEALASGQTTLSLTVADSDGATAAAEVVIIVPEPENNAPRVNVPGPVSLDVGQTRVLTLQASDPDGDPLSISDVGVSMPGVLSASPGQGVEVSLTGLAPGQAGLNVTVQDTAGATASAEIIVTVNEAAPPPNQGPSITPPDPLTLSQGGSVTLEVQASDPDGDPVSITTATSNPPDIIRTTVEGLTVLIDGLTLGTTTLSITVADPDGERASTEVQVTVAEPTAIPNEAPVLTPPEPLSIPAGQAATFTLEANDPDGDDLEIASLIARPEGIVRTSIDGLSITVEALAAGEATLSLTVADPLGATDSAEVPVSVTDDPNAPPIVEAIPDQTVQVDETISVSVQAEDPEGSFPFIASAESGSTEIVTVQPDGEGNLLLRGVSRGQVDVVVRVQDADGLTTTARFRVVVEEPTPEPNDPPIIETIPAQEVQIGRQITVPLTFSDPEGTQPFIMDVESGSTEIVTVEPTGVGNLVLTGVSEGQARITLTVSDGDDITTTTSFDVRVNPGPPDQAPQVQPIEDVTLAADETRTVAINATDPEGRVVSLLSVEAAPPGIVNVRPIELTLELSAEGAGDATVTFTVTDPEGQTTESSFGVTVQPAPPNAPPIVEPIPDQVVEVNQTITVSVVAEDPEGFQPFFALVDSSAPSIAVASNDGQGNISLAGVSPGSASISVIVADGQDGETTAQFAVTVRALPTPTQNAPPTIDPIPDQVVEVEQTIAVPVVASDPEGFRPFFESVTSSADQIVTARDNDEGDIVLTGVSPGTATVTVVMRDGQGGQATTEFGVRVPSQPSPTPDLPPTIEPVPDQTLEVEQTITVPVVASDPEGFRPFFVSVTSSADQIVTARDNGQGDIELTGISPGTATVNFIMSDGQGNEVSAEFGVTVQAAPEPNQAPSIEPIGNQQVVLEQFLPVTVTATDPEGGPITLTPTSSNADIAPVQLDENGNVVIFGQAPGTANITVTAIDPEGASSSAVFGVTVVAPTEEAPPPGPDIATIPILPPLEGDVLATIQGIAGGNNPNSLIVVGDTPPGALLADAATSGLDLSAQPGLQATLDAYLNQSAADSEASIVVEGGIRATNEDWRVADLLNAANNPPACATAPNPVGCSVLFQQPSVALVMIGRKDVFDGTAPQVFQRDLQAVVDQLRGDGVIPVLATLPGEANLVGPYNTAIVAVAQANALPVWNLARAVRVLQVNADLTLTSPGAGQNMQLTAVNVESFGTTRRNLSLLRLLEALRGAVPLGG